MQIIKTFLILPLETAVTFSFMQSSDEHKDTGLQIYCRAGVLWRLGYCMLHLNGFSIFNAESLEKQLLNVLSVMNFVFYWLVSLKQIVSNEIFKVLCKHII